MPMLYKRRILAAKIETTIGTAETLAAADAQFNAYDFNIETEAEFIERMGQSAFARLPGVIGARGGVCTFKHRLEPGSGAHPSWVSTFWPACGLVAATATYTPRTEAPGSNVKTLTIGLYEDGRFKSLVGAAGNMVLTFTNGQPVEAEFTFRGIWVAPTDVALITPDYPALKPLRFASATLTIASWAAIVQSVKIDLGNNVIMRPDGSTPSGYKSAIITDRAVNGTINPESVLVATNDTFAQWLAGTEQALSIALAESALGFTFSLPKMQIKTPQTVDGDGLSRDELEFQANRSADAGDDEFSCVLDVTP